MELIITIYEGLLIRWSYINCASTVLGAGDTLLRNQDVFFALRQINKQAITM